jgi:hypothetical protein
MGEVVNLRRSRKQAQRRQAEQHAELNRFKHGLGKAERALHEARQKKTQGDLDGHRIEPGDSR